MSKQSSAVLHVSEEQLVTMRIHNQLLGIPVWEAREILREQKITKIPLVASEIAGALNLRGRIVTVIDIRHRLQLPPRDPSVPCIFVVMEHKGELYSLIVDSVGDVLTIPSTSIQNAPPNLAPNWRDISAGVHRLEKELLIILDPRPLFTFGVESD
ncbi:MAG: chemotaxis protein CheW [Alphaproteobacteria bacterium]|nr:chemotaxis protein CheW [Alphaproteobacteria bacterium]